MTLFTLARALISASHVCCVALLSAYRQTTSAALHNRSFEGFLSLGEKKWRKSEDDDKNQRGKMHTNTSNVCCKPTNGRDRGSFLPLPLYCRAQRLRSLGLISLLVEVEAI